MPCSAVYSAKKTLTGYSRFKGGPQKWEGWNTFLTKKYKVGLVQPEGSRNTLLRSLDTKCVCKKTERDFFSEPIATEQEAVVLHWKVLSLHWTQWQNFYVVGGEPLDALSLEVLIVKFGWDFEQPVLWKVFLSPWQRGLVWSLNVSSNPNLSIIGLTFVYETPNMHCLLLHFPILLWQQLLCFLLDASTCLFFLDNITNKVC